MKKILYLLALSATSLAASAQAPQNALNFDGTDDYITCPLPGLFTNLANNDFTFEAWMKREASGRLFFAQVDPSNFATVLLSGANMLFYVKISNITYTSSVLIPPTSEWVHVAATWDASIQLPRLYFNGVLQTGTSGGASSSAVNNIMTIGSRTDGFQPFMGEMDEVRIWNVVRTDCEIRSMMHSEATGSESGLVSHYNFNRGTAGGDNPTVIVLPDQVGLNSGTLNNFALTGTTSNWVASTAAINAIGVQPAYQTTASAAICEGGSVVLGTQTLTESGTYDELFTSADGCDSLVSLTLTVNPVQTTATSVSACGSYTWPHNGTEYTTSGFYSDTLQSSTSCDSIVSLDLTILQATASTQTASACGSYTWPLNGQIYTTGGQYTDTIPNAASCDSIITLNLTILQATSSSQSAEACGSYQWPQNGATYTASGLYTDTIENAAGCDSIITLNLTILQPTASSQSFEACGSYLWLQNGVTYTESGVYTDTIPNAAGCDSILSLDLTIHYGESSVEDIASCGPYTWPADGQTYTISGNYSLNLLNVHGCDSILTLNLLVHDLPAAVITHDGTGTLTAATTAIVTSWIDCSTGEPIAGEQGLTFTPVQNGTYAVTLFDAMTFCSDTSECFAVNFAGLEENAAVALNLSPNPFSEQITVAFAGERAQLRLYDAHGKRLLTQTIVSGAQLELGSLQTGVYLIELETANGRAVKRVVKE